VHGLPPEQVHFHEVGATDAIVDIVGTCLGLDWLGIEALVCAPLPIGGGTIRAAHGRMPVPTPAVLKLFELRQVPLYSNGIQKELVTPTGAALATTLAAQFGPPPAMTLQRVGLGAGSRDLEIPNLLRIWLGETQEPVADSKLAVSSVNLWMDGPSQAKASAHNPSGGLATAQESEPSLETVTLLETQIDDLTPQAIAYVLETLLAAGALDVFTQAIAMKKSRLGVLLSVVCKPEDVPQCEAIVFRETTTLGIRRSPQQRHVLPRQIQTVETAYGPVRIKVAWANGQAHPPTNRHPEYEDCAHLARQHQIPWRVVHQAALCAAVSGQRSVVNGQ
jgi:pyridinium-3,5-bisthiocarboxylic acid mononucleotide nickel chelatase